MLNFYGTELTNQDINKGAFVHVFSVISIHTLNEQIKFNKWNDTQNRSASLEPLDSTRRPEGSGLARQAFRPPPKLKLKDDLLILDLDKHKLEKRKGDNRRQPELYKSGLGSLRTLRLIALHSNFSFYFPSS